MKSFSLIILVAIFAFLYPETAEASPSQCYFCELQSACIEPLKITQCPTSGTYRCISAKDKFQN